MKKKTDHPFDTKGQKEEAETNAQDIKGDAWEENDRQSNQEENDGKDDTGIVKRKNFVNKSLHNLYKSA